VEEEVAVGNKEFEKKKTLILIKKDVI